MHIKVEQSPASERIGTYMLLQDKGERKEEITHGRLFGGRKAN